MIGRRGAIGGLVSWWAAGNARRPMGPQAREAARPDRKPLGTSRAGVGPAPSQGTFIGRLVVVGGTGIVGFFEYNGAPGAGNPPIAYSAPPGVTKDPYGNALPNVGGGFVSNNPGVAISVLSAGGAVFALTGATPSAIDATIQVGLTGTGQSLQIGSGSVGADTQSLLLLNDSAVATGAFGPGLQVTDGGDGNTYDTERLTLRLATAFTINSTSAQAIFSKHLGVGTYEVEVWAVVLNSVAADGAGFAFAFSGTATGLMDYEAIDTAGSIAYVASNTLTTQGNSFGVAGNQRIEFNMTITVTVAGTLTWTGLELVAGNTVSVIQGSRMRICPVRAS